MSACRQHHQFFGVRRTAASAMPSKPPPIPQFVHGKQSGPRGDGPGRWGRHGRRALATAGHGNCSGN
jgi:hypothetical protein